MNIKKNILFFVICLVVVFVTAKTAYSQPPDPIDCVTDPSDPACPIDGGVTLLALAGATLGMFRKRKK